MSDSVRPQRRQPIRHPRPWNSPGKNTGVGFHFLLQCMKVKSESEVTQSCLTFRAPMDCSLPGSSVHGISRQEYWSGVPSPSPFFSVSLVRNNNIILVGKADQFWQHWWEKWILHLPRLGAGGPSLEQMLNRYR